MRRTARAWFRTRAHVVEKRRIGAEEYRIMHLTVENWLDVGHARQTFSLAGADALVVEHIADSAWDIEARFPARLFGGRRAA